MHRILIFLPYGIGDTIMQMPVIKEIVADQIVLAGTRTALQLFADDREISGVKAYEEWGIRHWWDDQCAVDEFRHWFEQQQFSLVYNLRHAPKKIRAALPENSNVSPDMDDAVFNSVISAGDNAYQAYYQACPGPRKSREPMAPALSPERLGRLPMTQYSAKPRFLLSASASLSMKRWPLERFARVVEDLGLTQSFELILISGAGEVWPEELNRLLRRPATRAQGWHLLDLAVLMARSHFLLCQDSGVMHLAAAMQLPLLALFGPTDPDRYLPRRPAIDGIGGRAVDCEKHGRRTNGIPGCWSESRCPCRSESCINEITATAVIEHLRKSIYALPAPANSFRQAAYASGNS